MRKIQTILTLFIFLNLISCQSDNESTEKIENSVANIWISGEIKGVENQPITLEFIDQRGTKEICSGTLQADGKFQLSAKIDELSLYQIRLGMGDRKVIPLTLVPKDKVKIISTFEDFEIKPNISGTIWAKPLSKYMIVFNEFAKKQVELMKRTDLDQAQQIAEFMKMKKPVDDFASNFISNNPSNPVNLVLSTSLSPAMGFEYWDKKYLEVYQKMTKSYEKAYPNSTISNSLSLQYEQIQTAYQDYMLNKSGEKEAPEIALKNPDGKEIKLSSLRGQVVLIDFWASWCGPCRKENPNVVRLYNQYKSKGFTVYSVSLDRDAQAWKQAIQQDGLIWPNHVSDLLQWNTPLTQTYRFNSIPYTVLVNRKGKIVGSNLRGEILEQKLKEIL